MVVALGPGQALANERFLTRPRVSQAELAKALGIHRGTLSAYENDWRALPDVGFTARYRAELKRLAREKLAKAS